MIDFVLLLICSFLFCRGMQYAFSKKGMLCFARRGVEKTIAIVAIFLGIDPEKKLADQKLLVRIWLKGTTFITTPSFHCLPCAASVWGITSVFLTESYQGWNWLVFFVVALSGLNLIWSMVEEKIIE